MSPQDARTTARWIAGLWPQSISPEQIAQMRAEFETDGYTEAGVRKLVDEFFTTRQFFAMTELRERLRVRREARNLQYEKQKQEIHRTEEYWVRVARAIELIPDAELIEFASAAVAALPESIRPLYAGKDPRRCKPLMGAIFERMQE